MGGRRLRADPRRHLLLLGVLFFYAGKEKLVENEGVAELFLYTGATGVQIGLVLLLPPYRPLNRISGRGDSR